MLVFLWVKAGYKKIRSERTGKERAEKWLSVGCIEPVEKDI